MFLETVHFSLTDEDVELLDLELNEINESSKNSKSVFKCRINALHAGTTKNLHTYPLEELELSAKKWTKPYGKPVLKNHDILEEPLGRVEEASVLRYGDNEGVLSMIASIPDKDAAEKIRDQRYVTVSVGVTSRTVECSICGQNWFDDECEHEIGEKYDGSICTAVIRKLQPVEVSFVNLPADANDERFAGVIAMGESEDFEFFSGAGKGVAKSKKKSSDDDIALALKETWQDFLGLLNTEGEETQVMDEETKTQETISTEEKDVEDAVTNEEQDLDVVSEEAPVSEEATEGESTEEETTSDETSVVSELDSLSDYLSDESEDVTSEKEVVEESVTENIDTLQGMVRELEDENVRLKQSLKEQEDAAAEIAKNVRLILSRHVADLKVILNKADTDDVNVLEAETSQHTIKELVIELKELRKELKESDLNVSDLFSQNGILKQETIVNSTQKEDVVDTNTSEAPAPTQIISEKALVQAMTERLSTSRPYKRKGQ